MDDKLEEIINNMERMNESIAALKLREEKNTLVIYGSKDIHLPGLLNRMEVIEEAIENINGMPQQVKQLQVDVNGLVETDKARRNMIRGISIGFMLQGGGIAAILAKVFS